MRGELGRTVVQRRKPSPHCSSPEPLNDLIGGTYEKK